MGKFNIKKRKRVPLEIVPQENENEPLPPVRHSDDPIPKKVL